ncbi:hypothetical protein BC936DRAFT_143974 [Jimgerdemannia flammicorona]|uniref:Cns1/TTC4 wheel domain-containing protein n=1 Tax=Jimgerdemannia flammicorona TaxID=994334 RepID=A0A433DD94_9FUNG|nr:hypothetical protein BC936DRAFT_143974 [Jimgerdemannia flammicorona]
MEACHANRAAVNLELQNYGMVLKDCAKALGYNPRNIKVLYRSARALYALDRVDEAIDCCDHALAVEPENVAVKAQRERCVEGKRILEEKRRVVEERERRESERKEALAKAIEVSFCLACVCVFRQTSSSPPKSPHQSRGIKIETPDATALSTANIVLDPSTDTLTWPVFFLYPEYKESDHIQAFDETHTFQDHLDVIFEHPAPWDQRENYTARGVEVYFEHNAGLHPGLVKVGKKLPLGEVLKHPKYVVQNGIPSFIVLPREGPFKEVFLARYKK